MTHGKQYLLVAIATLAMVTFLAPSDARAWHRRGGSNGSWGGSSGSSGSYGGSGSWGGSNGSSGSWGGRFHHHRNNDCGCESSGESSCASCGDTACESCGETNEDGDHGEHHASYRGERMDNSGRMLAPSEENVQDNRYRDERYEARRRSNVDTQNRAPDRDDRNMNENERKETSRSDRDASHSDSDKSSKESKQDENRENRESKSDTNKSDEKRE